MPSIEIIHRGAIMYSKCLCGSMAELLVSKPYTNEISIAKSHPLTKLPFCMNLVYLKPATPNAKIRTNGNE